MSGLPDHVVRRKRKGRVDLYFWHGRTGDPWIRIHEEPGTVEFQERYLALLRGSAILKKGVPKPEIKLASVEKPNSETFRWLVVEYFKSAEFKVRDRAILESCCREPLMSSKPNGMKFGDLPISKITMKEMKVLQDRKAKEGLPWASRMRTKTLRRFCRWAREAGHLAVNPMLELRAHKAPKTDGYVPWDRSDVEKFEKRWPVGTMQNLAMRLMVLCGLAKVDAIAVGPKNVEESHGQKLLHYVRAKTTVHGHPPMPRDLLDAIAKVNLKSTTHFLLTSYGKPFASSAAFGNWFRGACDAAEVTKAAHGCRKQCAITYAERGIAAMTLCRIMAWDSLKVAEVYIRNANMKKMAALAVALPD
jgi:hypothetical protein